MVGGGWLVVCVVVCVMVCVVVCLVMCVVVCLRDVCGGLFACGVVAIIWPAMPAMMATRCHHLAGDAGHDGNEFFPLPSMMATIAINDGNHCHQ